MAARTEQRQRRTTNSNVATTTTATTDHHQAQLSLPPPKIRRCRRYPTAGVCSTCRRSALLTTLGWQTSAGHQRDPGDLAHTTCDATRTGAHARTRGKRNGCQSTQNAIQKPHACTL